VRVIFEENLSSEGADLDEPTSLSCHVNAVASLPLSPPPFPSPRLFAGRGRVRGLGEWPHLFNYAPILQTTMCFGRTLVRFKQSGYSPRPLTLPCMRSFLSRGKFAWCLAPGGASGVRSRRAPARRNLGGAKCRWPDACQGRSRRRRWPKASLYKGLASDDDRRPRSVGRDYAHLSLDLSPLPRA
jgi:hypothetical protein